MRGIPSKEWKVFADGDESENIPLWRGLAQFTSDDLDAGLKANAEIINQEKPIFRRYYNAAFIVSLLGGVLTFGFLLVWLIAVQSNAEAEDALFLTVLILLAATAVPHVWRQVYQYGLNTPDAPLTLPHSTDRHFDDFLGYLQRASGPQAYYLPRFGKKRKPLDRRQFFGRLRYFLFSEHSADRRLVMRFRTGMALPSDIFIHRNDLERMLAERNANAEPDPKRKGGQGVSSKYPYEDAIVAVLGSDQVKALNLDDRDATIKAVRKMLVVWLTENSDETANAPREDYPRVKQCAEKIYSILKNLSDK